MAYYQDLRKYLEVLEAKGKLVRVKRLINKDTELMPLVRWQFRGLPEEKRKAWLFENVTDIKGRKYTVPVAVGTHAGSKEIYALAMNCGVDEVADKWAQALSNPIEPVMVKTGPVQEEVYMGEELEREGNGFEKLPIPISSPGFDPAPFLTSGCWVTKDPETGTRNVGVYRGHIKGRTRTGVSFNSVKHIGIHWDKCHRLGKELQAALVLGATPNVGLVAVTTNPYGKDELAVAGGIAGEPVKLVKCKTVDLEVPATAEVVMEGIIHTDYVEPEAPFGEYTGYMGARHYSAVFEVKCMTHRKNPIYHAFLSQFPPSESSKIRRMGVEGNLTKFLRQDCNIHGLKEVAIHEESGSYSWVVVCLERTTSIQPWQALNCLAGYSHLGKVFVAVDDDIDPKDLDAVVWAISFRMQPHRDVRIAPGKSRDLDHSAAPPEFEGEHRLGGVVRETSSLLINATRKWDYPPIALPKREYMERAKEIWEEMGLPQLTPKAPWFGYSLGLWGPENEEEAQIALKGDHYQTGEKLAGRREWVKPK